MSEEPFKGGQAVLQRVVFEMLTEPKISYLVWHNISSDYHSIYGDDVYIK